MTTVVTRMRWGLFVLAFVQLWDVSVGFQPIQSGFYRPQHAPSQSSTLRPPVLLSAVEQEEETTSAAESSVNDEATRLRKEAELMRLQAEQMDMSLTLQKIASLESKLKNKSWLAKHPDQEAELQEQLQRLNDKLTTATNANSGTENMPSILVEAPKSLETPLSVSIPEETPDVSKEEKASSASLQPPSSGSKTKKLPEKPIAGFDKENLEVSIPVAKDIEKMMPNSKIEERVQAFRSAPEIQALYYESYKKMLMDPLEEMQQLENRRQAYLDSNSSREREQLKREIGKLEEKIQNDVPSFSSDGWYCDALTPLSEEELAQRVKAVGDLPELLIAVYKHRAILSAEDDLELAVQIDYYEPQIELLEKARVTSDFTDDMRNGFIKGFESLPKPVQKWFAVKCGAGADSDGETVLRTILNQSSDFAPFVQVMEESQSSELIEPAEYNDIDFVDRSRFLEEFFPSIGNMEGMHPSMSDVEQFVTEVLDRKTFMVTNKPERVAGGYYIRGTNLLEDDEDESKTAADKLVARVSENLTSSSLSDKLDFFYILDPTPPTDEELEIGETQKPLFVVITKDPQKLYGWVKPQTKLGISFAGVLSTFMFSVGACALNPSITERFYGAMDTATDLGTLDLAWLSELCLPIFTALVGIVVAHEIAHFAIAKRDKFNIGLPTFVPSITTALTGGITPLRTPPPNSKSMFDFAIAGPIAGMVVSVTFLLSGLDLTASMAMGTQLPVLPVDFIRASSLGAGLTEYFLGNTVILPDQGPAAVLQLHPYAIAGIVGLVTNALALLPLGHTDGGRIAIAMFGRKGAFIVKLFTAVLLCAAGLFKLDDANILLFYILYVLVFQRELETPSRNEVDELDFPRGLVATAAALAVGLALIPTF